MSSNFKSNFIFAQIMGYFSTPDYDFINSTQFKQIVADPQLNGTPDRNTIQKKENKLHFDIVVVGPSLKNKIELDNSKPRSFFIDKYAKLYDANKAHSKSNLLWWLKMNNKENMLTGIKKKNIDDVADSFIQAFAWSLYKN